MKKIDKIYPQYDWKNNKGYGTKIHIDKINQYGLSQFHRNSFKIKSKQLSIKI